MGGDAIQFPPNKEFSWQASSFAAGIFDQSMNVPRSEIAKRCLLLRCPNCDASGQLRTWFRLHPACPRCGLKHGGEEGFTLGTTSIGYVVAFLFVVLPVCILVVMNLLSVWLGI